MVLAQRRRAWRALFVANRTNSPWKEICRFAQLPGHLGVYRGVVSFAGSGHKFGWHPCG
jgi:hypothetical protein